MIFRRGWRVAPALVAGLLGALSVAVLLPGALLPAEAGGVPFRTVDLTGASGDLHLDVFEVSPVALTRSDTLRVTGVAANRGTGTVKDLVVRLRVNTTNRLTSREDLDVWSKYEAGEAPGDVFDERDLGSLGPGQTTPFTVEVPGATLNLGQSGAAFGPYGVVVEVTSTAPAADVDPDAVRPAPIAGVNTSVVWHPIKEYRPTALSVILPVLREQPTTDASSIDPSLAPQFAPEGRLSRLIRAGADPRVAWSLDPALLAAADRGVVAAEPTGAPTPSGPATPSPSGPATPSQSGPATPSPTGDGSDPGSDQGSDQGSATTSASESSPSVTAPAETSPSATATPDPVTSLEAGSWLDAVRVGSADRDVYLQPWADPDVSAVATAGNTTLLDQADRWAHDASVKALGRDHPLDVAVPAPGGINNKTAETLAGVGRDTLVVRDEDRALVREVDYTVSAGFRIKTGGTQLLGLASDTRLSQALELSGRLGSPQQAVARQRFLAELAAVTLEWPGDPRHLLAVLPRAWDADPVAFAATIDAIGQADWISFTPVDALRRQPPPENGEARLRPARATTRGPGAKPLPTTHVLITSHTFTRIHAFAPALVDPEPLLEPLSIRAVSIVGSAWRASTSAQLAVARAPLTLTSTAMYTGVNVAQGGPYNVLTESSGLPLVLSNDLPYPVKVVLRALPRSGIIRMDDVEVELEANSQAVPVKVPFRGISNGNVFVDTRLETVDGTRISGATTLEVRVRRNWESRGMAAAVLALLVLLFVGLLRSVRRGRRRRLSPDEQPPDVDQILAARERQGLDDAEEPWRRGTPAHRHLAGGGGSVQTMPWVHAGLEPEHQAEPEPERRPEHQPAPGDPHESELALAQDLPESVAGGEAIMRSSLIMAAGTATSRLLGFARSAVLAVAITTTSLSADAFSTANKVPNIIYLLIAGGVLNAVLVPQIARAAHDGERGRIYVDRLLSVALVGLVVTTVLVSLAAPMLMKVYSGGEVTESQLNIATMFAYWCLPQVFFYGLYTLLGQVLNARGHFGAYMWAPALNNVVAILGLVTFIWLAGEPVSSEEWWTQGRVALLAGSATLGVAVQALVLIPVLRRSGFTWHFRWGLRGSGLGGASRIALWTFGAVLLAQLAFIITSRVLTDAGHGSRESYGGAPAVGQVSSGSFNYDLAFLLFMLPHSLIAVSLVTALFTRLSHSASTGDLSAVRDDLSLGLRITGTATAGATAALIACAPLFTTLMGWNIGVAYGAMAMSLGLIAFSAQYLLQRVFYAYQDARTPFLIQIPVVVVTVLGALASARLLDPRWVLVGIGLTMTASSLLAVVISLVLLHRRLRGLDGRHVTTVYGKLAFAACVAGGIGWVAGRLTVSVLRALDVAPESGSIGGVGQVSAGIALLVSASFVLVVYGLALRATGVAELDYVLRPLAGMVRRAGFGRPPQPPTDPGSEPEPTRVHPDGRAPRE